MALNEEQPTECQSQFKHLSLGEVKAMRRALLPKIKKLKRNPRCHTLELRELQKQNLLLKDEIASRRIKAEKAARPQAQIIAFPAAAAALPPPEAVTQSLAATG